MSQSSEDRSAGEAYPEHVYESIRVMDEERVNIDAIAALVHHIDETREGVCWPLAWHSPFA